MTLEKLTIKHETTTSNQFDGEIVALFNPNKLTYQRSLSWKTVDPASLAKTGRRGRLQFQSVVPETLALELFFDTYELSNQRQGLFGALLGSLSPFGSSPPSPVSVLQYTREIEALGSYMKELHRPPACRIEWGRVPPRIGIGPSNVPVVFTGVLTQMSKTLDLFHENGTPLRATMQCTFQDVSFTGELHSPDVAKTYVVQPRDTLLRIAALLYEDASLWRVIAQANGIDDPRVLAPGQILAIPAIR